MKVTRQRTAVFVLVVAGLIWLLVRPEQTSPAPVGGDPRPLPLTAAREIAAGSPRGLPPAPAAQPAAATRTPGEAFRESAEYQGHAALMLELYGPLISQLQLEPARAADLLDLLVESRLSVIDALALRREEKLSPDAAFPLVEKAATAMDGRIRDLLGPDRHAAFNTYRERLPPSLTVRKLRDLLAATESPLTDGQAQRLGQLYHEMQSALIRNYPASVGLIQVNGTRLTDEMIRASAAVLSPSQWSHFEKLPEQQERSNQDVIRAIAEKYGMKTEPPAEKSTRPRPAGAGGAGAGK